MFSMGNLGGLAGSLMQNMSVRDFLRMALTQIDKSTEGKFAGLNISEHDIEKVINFVPAHLGMNEMHQLKNILQDFIKDPKAGFDNWQQTAGAVGQIIQGIKATENMQAENGAQEEQNPTSKAGSEGNSQAPNAGLSNLLGMFGLNK